MKVSEFRKLIREEIRKVIKEDNTAVIGKPIKIIGLEVSRKDFPKKMNWDDAKKACKDLREGWRLPTIEELDLLYKNRKKIGGFVGNDYWSSTEDGNGEAGVQDFSNGEQYGNNEDHKFSVRAVRSIK